MNLFEYIETGEYYLILPDEYLTFGFIGNRIECDWGIIYAIQDFIDDSYFIEVDIET